MNGTLDPTTLATSGSNYGILPFDNSSSSNGSWTNTTSDATFTTTTGIGYAMAKSNEGTVAFTGVPNTFTNTDVAITNNTSGSGTHWNLVANPFPAFIALNGDAKPTLQLHQLFYGIMQIMLMYLVIQDLTKVFGIGTVLIILLKIIVHLEIYMQYLGQAFFISAESSGNVSFRTGNVTTQASIGSGDDFIPGDDLMKIKLKFISQLRKT